jgi:hypothetical protein
MISWASLRVCSASSRDKLGQVDDHSLDAFIPKRSRQLSTLARQSLLSYR